MSDLVQHDKEVIDDIAIMANDWRAGFWPRALARATLRILRDRDAALESQSAEIERLRKDAALLSWVLTHPETAAEELQDAAWGTGTARENLERRIAGIDAAKEK